MQQQKSIAECAVVMAYVAQFTPVGDAIDFTFLDMPFIRGTVSRDDDPFPTAQLRLDVAIKELIASRARIPAPVHKAKRIYSGVHHRYERAVPVEQVLAMKAILWDNLRHNCVSEAAIAKLVNCDLNEVNQILDPTDESPFRLGEALEAIGSPIAITIVDTSPPRRILGARRSSSPTYPIFTPVIAAPGPAEGG